ncbi:MAG: hypothetical protein WBB43_29810 [Limnoraphis sp.]
MARFSLITFLTLLVYEQESVSFAPLKFTPSDSIEIALSLATDSLSITQIKRVIFIHQGSLFLVLFAALIDQQRTPMIEHHTLSIVPAIQVLELNIIPL